MAQIVRDDKDQLNTTITLNLKPADYEPKFKSQMNKYQREAHMKGFRKGKTPMSFVKKMHGKSVFAEVMNEAIQNNLFDFIEKENIKYIGQPLSAEGYETPEIDFKNIGEYVFKFDIGIYPDFEMKGADSSHTVERPALEGVPDEKLNEQIDRICKERGTQDSVDAPVEDNDMLVLDVKELDGKAIKEGGVENEFRVLMNENIYEAAKKQLLGKKKDDVVRLNIFELEQKMERKMVRKYFLGLEDAEDTPEEELPTVGENFEATIKDVLRLKPAEKTEEFFKEVSNGQFSNEEEAKEFLTKDLKTFYENQMNAILNYDLREKLLDQNHFEMPDAFLKRWLSETNGYTAERLENEYDSKIKDDLRWSIIIQKLIGLSDVKVEEQEVIAAIKHQITTSYGLSGMGDEMLDGMVRNLIEKHPQQYEQMYQELTNSKVFDYVRAEITIEDKLTSLEDLDKIIADFRAAQEAKQAAAIVENVENKEEE